MPSPSKLAAMLAIGGNEPAEMDDEAPPQAGMPPEEGAESQGECLIDLPKGFRAPSGVVEGEPFSTTVRGKIVGGQFQVEAIGDMPMSGKAEVAEMPPQPQEEEEPQAQPQMNSPEAMEGAALQKRKGEEMAARKAFQPGR